MRVISKKALIDFWTLEPSSRGELEAWYAESKTAQWQTPAEVKAKYGNASILRDGRVVFNICGNRFRLVVWINYDFFTSYVRFVGTHADYDTIDAQTILGAVAMKPKILKTPVEYELALARIETIFDAKPGTAKGDELELLLVLVEKYEDVAFPINLPNPITAIRFRMEQQNLEPKDLVPYIGSKSKVAEVLSGQRSLSLSMIRNLVIGLGIPAEVLLQKSETQTVSMKQSRV